MRILLIKQKVQKNFQKNKTRQIEISKNTFFETNTGHTAKTIRQIYLINELSQDIYQKKTFTKFR